MKNLFFIACFMLCATSAMAFFSSGKDATEQLVRIMMSNTKDRKPYLLEKNRNPSDYHNVYNLAIKNPKLLKGIVHDEKTFAMLCITSGYADVLERLITEDYGVDLTTPCQLYSWSSSTSVVLDQLLYEVSKLRESKDYPEDYSARIRRLTKLIINKYPDLLDTVRKRQHLDRNRQLNDILYDLFPRGLPQTSRISKFLSTESSVAHLLRIMMPHTEYKRRDLLGKERNPDDYQDVYNFAVKHPELLHGILHDERTFAVLCVERGYIDVLERLIKEGYCVDLATPCNVMGPNEPQTTVLHELFFRILLINGGYLGLGSRSYPEEYSARITAFTKLIINNYPALLDIEINRQRTARGYAMNSGNLHVSHLIPRDEPQLERELFDACRAANVEAVQEIIKKPGININQADKDGITPLFAACKNGNLRIIKALVAAPGIDINKGDNNGDTPMIIAADYGNIEAIEILLSLKKSDGSFAVNINQSNKDGVTPLLLACQNGSSLTVEKLLTVAGIDVNKADNSGETPLLVLCKNKFLDFGLIHDLLENGADNRANKKGETPLNITKDSRIYGQLEFYLVGEVHASKWCTGLSAKQCKEAKEQALRYRKAKEGIAFHE